MLNTEIATRERFKNKPVELLTPAPKQIRRRVNSETTLSLATINVRNLRLRTYIGFNPEERVKQQDVVINILISYTVDYGIHDDDIQAALDYKIITKKVIRHVEDGQFLLLEKLVADVLAICSNQPAVMFARVTVDKPHALRFADSVSLTLEYAAESDATSISGEG